MRILEHALEVPTRQIAANSGVDGGVVVDRMRAGSGAFGFTEATLTEAPEPPARSAPRIEDEVLS